jgi:hypothetical protein
MFAHGATIALSRGLIDYYAASFMDDCLANYRIWEAGAYGKNYFADVEIGVCFKMMGLFPRKVWAYAGSRLRRVLPVVVVQ